MDAMTAKLELERAEMEAKLGNYDDARRLYRAGLTADPFHAQLFHSYAEMEVSKFLCLLG